MNLFKKIALILFLLIFTLLLRTYKMTSVPNGFYVDEAAIGYNAYSVLTTGADEYGKHFPIFLRSFGAFSSPLYTYLTVISIKLFGLTIFATRLVSLVSGIIQVGVFYLLLKELAVFKNKNTLFVTTFLFSITPWTVFFSRAAFEANLSLLFISTGVLFFSYWTKKENTLLVFVSFLFFALSAYTYQAHRLSAALLVPSLLVINYKKVLLNKKSISSAMFFLFLVLIPQIILLTTEAFTFRAGNLSYINDVVTQIKNVNLGHGKNFLTILTLLREFFSQFVAYFSPANLFFRGDSDLQRSIPEMSVFYFWMVVPYIVGIFQIIRKSGERKSLVIYMMLIAFSLPAALTKDPFSTLRSFGLIIPLMMVIGFGVDRILTLNVRIVFVSLFVLVLISLVMFWRSYFILFPAERAVNWGFGVDQVSRFVASRPDSKFVLDTGRSKPMYIQLAFYQKINPEIVQNISAERVKNGYYSFDGFDPNYKINNFETREINWNSDVYINQIMVGDGLSFSDEQIKEHYLQKVLEVRDPINRLIFVGYQTNPDLKCINTNYLDKMCERYKK